MSSTFEMDPEFRALIAEVAGNPDARLLRVSGAQMRATLYERDRRVSATAPFLKHAERHLLQAYRDQLGRLLYRTGILLRSEGHAPSFWHYGDRRAVLPERAALQRDTRHVASRLEGKIDGEDPGWLVDLLAGQATRTSAAELFAAALRVRPSPMCVRELGVEMMCAEGANGEAARLLYDALDQEPAGTTGSYSWEAIAWASSRAGRAEALLDACRRAVLCDPERSMPAFFWVSASLQNGDLEQFSVAASHALSAGTRNPLALDWYVHQLVVTKQQGIWRPSREFGRILAGVEKHANDVARRIIHAFR